MLTDLKWIKFKLWLNKLCFAVGSGQGVGQGENGGGMMGEEGWGVKSAPHSLQKFLGKHCCWNPSLTCCIKVIEHLRSCNILSCQHCIDCLQIAACSIDPLTKSKQCRYDIAPPLRFYCLSMSLKGTFNFFPIGTWFTYLLKQEWWVRYNFSSPPGEKAE